MRLKNKVSFLTISITPTIITSFHTPPLAFRQQVPKTKSSLQTATTTSPSTSTTSNYEDLTYPPVHPFGTTDTQPTTSLSSEPTSQKKAILGGKGANLAEMSSIKLPVPPGFTITTECCQQFCSSWNYEIPPPIWNEILDGVGIIEKSLNGPKFGNKDDPLLLSVRSGAAISMPGMMDTVLNLGMNDEVCEGLSLKSDNPRFAWDSYRRFLEMFGNVVLEIPRSEFEEEMDDLKYEVNAFEDSELNVDHLKTLVDRFKSVYEKNRSSFPQDPNEQLKLAVGAVFRGWMGPRAVKYRQVENIRNLLGTAVNVQAMVFGNMGPTSGTGVCFTRDPNSGVDALFGEFLMNAQGEDVVAGTRTPQPISELQSVMPEVYDQFCKNTDLLEGHYGDMQDIEFTVQEGRLFMLQTRNGKRGGEAAVKIAVDMVSENLISKTQAVSRVLPEHLDQLLHPRFSDVESEDYKSNVMSSGLPASPGAAVGKIAFSNEKVVENKEAGIPSVLVRDETSPDDVEGMYESEGILTARGGMTSHAAVVARGWGRPCICGCTALAIDEEGGTVSITMEDGSVKILKEGDDISLNGNTGEVLMGKLDVSPPAITGDLATFMGWVDEARTMGVLANADTPEDAAEARKNGAEGIGLCRTEHMFFDPRRISRVRQLILGDETQSTEALQDLLTYQRQDFEGIFEAMDGLPVTIRLLDPPLHEFLPSLEGDMEVFNDLASSLSTTPEELLEKVKAAEEVNPMLGLRGCRLGITRPAIVEMQVRAVIEAALNAKKRGVDARPDIMVPLVGRVEEFLNQKELILRVVKEVYEERGIDGEKDGVPYKIGTMIEIPRAALISSQIAEEAEFFSFGSNDLTQMTFGYSRDDVGTFVPKYINMGILEDDPFVTLDVEGVGKLIKMAVDNGREVKPNLKIGVCGEHGGDPRSVTFFNNEAGLSYVSCSPFRVPIARLAAAQANDKK